MGATQSFIGRVFSKLSLWRLSYPLWAIWLFVWNSFFTKLSIPNLPLFINVSRSGALSPETILQIIKVMEWSWFLALQSSGVCPSKLIVQPTRERTILSRPEPCTDDGSWVCMAPAVKWSALGCSLCKFLAISAADRVNFKREPVEPETIILNGPAKWLPLERKSFRMKELVKQCPAICGKVGLMPMCDLPVVLRKRISVGVFFLHTGLQEATLRLRFGTSTCASQWIIMLSTTYG